MEVARRMDMEVNPRITLAKGLEPVPAILAELGLMIPPSQPETPAISNCLVEVLWAQINQLENQVLSKFSL